MSAVIFDVETTGLPKQRNAPLENTELWPYIVQISWIVIDIIDGEITDINQSIVDDPGAVNKDPEGAAWFFKIKIKNKSELDQLMSKADYDKFAKENPN